MESDPLIPIRSQSSKASQRRSPSRNREVSPVSISQISPTVQRSNGFPSSVGFIIGTEFCERFSYYGMRTILFVYLQSYLKFTEDHATAYVHLFVMMAYFFPLVGGILSDSYWGKFKTIWYLSIIYCLGNLVLSITAIPSIMPGNPPSPIGATIGLALLAIGTGGIKPCVSAFGGDQFDPSQESLIQQYFSLFYFSINAGSVLSTILTPELRSLGCFGMTTCFPLAFGVPAILMLVAVLIFVSGYKRYKMVPPSGNRLVTMMAVIQCGLKSRLKKRGIMRFFGTSGYRSIFGSSTLESNNQIHWLDEAIPVYGDQLVQEIKIVLGILYMFLPLPFFWTLYDQQSSRWVAQAQLMNRNVTVWNIFSNTPLFSFIIKPEQMQVTNALLILVMIPVFEKWIYPTLRYFHFDFRPLKRMATGMSFCALSFIVAGFLQMRIEMGDFEEKNGYKVCVDNCTSIFWQIPQYVIITAGEIMFSITGLDFAYSQAPASMKSVLQSAWLLTTAVGNLVVVLVAESTFIQDSSTESFFFALLITMAMIIFSIMSLSYKYVQSTIDEDIHLQSPTE